MRVLAVDPGMKRIGLALSDLTGMIASPLVVIKHISRVIDAAAIVNIASNYEVDLIVIGQALDSEGNVGVRARQSQRLAEAIHLQTALPVELWDESGSTIAARNAVRNLKSSQRNINSHFDNIAAAVILQDYLDTHENKK